MVMVVEENFGSNANAAEPRSGATSAVLASDEGSDEGGMC